jgi:glycosyltransferase involved in cell wall biosynthesis
MLAHRTITISTDAFERARRLPFAFKKAVLIYNGIETPEFETPVAARASLRSIDHTIPERGLLVGTIAELHPNKDLKTALDAIALISNAHLCTIGEGEEKARLLAHAREKGLESRVHFVGYVTDAAKYLRAFDVFLLTSIKEGLPYVLLEAGSACVPIVAVDIPGVRDIVLNEFTGLTAPRDPVKIAAAINRISSETALTHSLTDEMTTRIQKTFSLKQMLEKTVAFYQAPFNA